MKAMTAKEFWTILDEAGFSHEKDYERILNALAGYSYDMSTTAFNSGCKAAADRLTGIANKIHDALDARGYYDDVKQDAEIL